MGRKHQNGGVVGKKRIYYDGANTGVHDMQTIYDSFSGAPTNREGYNKGIGTPGPIDRRISVGNVFDMTLIPSAGDSYTLSQLGSPAATGAWTTNDRYYQSDWVRILINGQGRGVLGTGNNGLSSTNFQLNANTTGNGTFGFSTYADAFQPGTPHETGFFWARTASSGGTLYSIGGSNNTTSIGGSSQNGNVYSWRRSSADTDINDTRVILMGNTTGGHVVFQYKIYNGASGTQTSGKVVRILHQYTNTTGSTKYVSFQRGGDVDFNAYTTSNTRVDSTKTYSSGTSNGQTLAVYLPATPNTVAINPTPSTRNTLIANSFTIYNPENVAANTVGRTNGNQDTSIYMGANWGAVSAGSTVFACGYYVYGTSATDMNNQIL
jgi:hypothetical protein